MLREISLFEFAGLSLPEPPPANSSRLNLEKPSDQRNDLEFGKAAEHLVCADLILSGYRAFLADQGLPYDVVVDIDSKFIRIQVKATRSPKNPSPVKRKAGGYFFHLRRAGKGGRRRYGHNAFDMFALVAMDIRGIAYFGDDDLNRQTIALRAPGVYYESNGQGARYIEQATFERALSRIVR